MSLPVGIGLAGLGRWGRNYVKTLLALPECRLVAVADPNPAALAAVADLPGVAKRESAARLFSDPTVEAVIIATPDHAHYSLSAAAVESGRDVLVEKPMTLTVAEAESLVRLAEAGSRVLAVGHTAVYSTAIDALRVQLDALPCGATHRVTAERTSSGPPPVDSSLISRHSAILFDLCPHDIALAILLFGSPVAARAVSSRDGVEYAVRFEGDQLLEGRAEWRQPPHVRRFEVAGTESDLGIRQHVTSHNDIRRTPLGRQCLDFIACCRSRRQPLSSGRLGLAVVRCLAALDSSCADSGAWVQLHTEFRPSNDECRVADTETPELGVRT